MKILFTGSSSFTGYHFIKCLVKDGHDLTITFSKNKNFYLKQKNNRSERVKDLIKNYDCNFNVDFSNEKSINFLKKISSIDVFCHHFADTSNYKSNKYDLYNALENNTKILDESIKILKGKGLKDYIYTGSYFEPAEEFSLNYNSFSSYGLSKSLTGQIIRHYCHNHSVNYKKFIIPNPLGELEDENRLTTFVAKQWIDKKIFVIQQPAYLRDNIPIKILSKRYSYFIKGRKLKLDSPSFYRLSNLDFIALFSKEMKKRSNLKCEFNFINSPKYTEPMKKFNDNRLKINEFKITATDLWDELIKYYLNI